jgi:1,4-alpha-glucan branching enzyme
MSIKKQFLKSRPSCKVTFLVDKEDASGAHTVGLLGEFNNWNTAEPVNMKMLKNGTFKVTLELPAEREYQFKYLLNNEVWINDENADRYVENGINTEENSVVFL